jgi:hypothetical protein
MFMTVVDLIGPFIFQNDDSIRCFTDLRQIQGVRKIPKTVLETRLKFKETTYTLFFEKYLVVSIEAFSVFLKDSLRIISET